MKATKKPITIDFYTWEEIREIERQLTDGKVIKDDSVSFQFESVVITRHNDAEYIIPTLEGDHLFTPKDVLIKGVKGELYPCKKEIFEMTYDIATDTANPHLESKKA